MLTSSSHGNETPPHLVKQLRDPASGDITEREVEDLPSGHGWARLRFSAEERTSLQKESPALTSAILDSLDGADRILTKRLTELDKIPHIGALHRAIFYRGIARLRLDQGDRGGSSDSTYFAGLAMSTASEAGLVHQLREM